MVVHTVDAVEKIIFRKFAINKSNSCELADNKIWLFLQARYVLIYAQEL